MIDGGKQVIIYVVNVFVVPGPPRWPVVTSGRLAKGEESIKRKVLLIRNNIAVSLLDGGIYFLM